MIATDLPEEKGTYALIASVTRVRRLKIGQLGAHDIVPGYYVYVGSAFGAGGLRARIGHHLESTANPHWHIDYLLAIAQPVEVWYSTVNQKLEHHWAELFDHGSQFRAPITRFGCSDYHRSRSTHLFYSKRRPSFSWFEQQVRERFEDASAARYVVASSAHSVA